MPILLELKKKEESHIMLYKNRFPDEMSLGYIVPNSPLPLRKFTLQNSILHVLRNLEEILS